MFGWKKKTAHLDPQAGEAILSPVAGSSRSLAELSDRVFAQGMMGQGFALQPDGGPVRAPISGQVKVMNGHAVGLQRADGLELIIHIGLDTVALAGRPFTALVKVGSTVAAGQALVQVDWAAIWEAGYDPVTLVLLPNFAGKLAMKLILTDHLIVQASEHVADTILE